MPRLIRGIILDKDGTMFDFTKTWAPFVCDIIRETAQGNAELANQLGIVLGFDSVAMTFAPDSMVIADTFDVIVDAIFKLLPEDTDKVQLVNAMNARSATTPQVEVTPLLPFIQQLKSMGMQVGVVTNDAELATKQHLEAAGVLPLFDFISGYNSGHGSKPDPGPLLAFCASQNLDPASCVMGE
jgi:phosphoglycolate phosphatase